MVSECAEEDIEELARQGIVLTPREVVRINALGLRMERPERPADSAYYLPRIAILPGDVVLHEPTIGHEIWLDEVERIMDMVDVGTNLSVTAFCLSVRDAADLPPSDSRLRVVAALASFRRAVRGCTASQLAAACRYATEGRFCGDGEYTEARADRDDDIPDGAFSVGVGMLVNSTPVRCGLSVADACRMTRSQLQLVVDKAVAMQVGSRHEDAVNLASGEYHATLDAIVAAHKDAVNNG